LDEIESWGVAMRSMTLDVAQRIVTAACQEAERLGISVSVVVADQGGHVIAAARMDGVAFGNMSVALDKAYSAAAFAAPTSRWASSTLPGESNWGFHAALGGRMIVYGGGLPVISDGEAIAAVGVSGSAASNDVACARAGILAVGLDTAVE
jgi:uncharacterized protein GlcG (DUF336 family)